MKKHIFLPLKTFFNFATLSRAPIDEENQETIVLTDDVITSDGLAVDWIYNHIYWTDSVKNTIELSDFDGRIRKTLIYDELQEPRAIVVNPLDGWMYWTDWGVQPKIERAAMDGTHRKILISTDIRWANGLTLDLVKKKIYWVDAKLNTISLCNYDGTSRQTVLRAPDILRHPFSITTFEDWVYWTDWDKDAIFKANKFNGRDSQPVTAIGMVCWFFIQFETLSKFVFDNIF